MVSAPDPLLSADDKARLLLEAFPRRPLRILHGGGHNYVMVFGIFFALMMLVVLGGALKESLPGMVTDAKFRWGAAYAVDELATVSGACKRMKFIIVSCSGKINYYTDGPDSAVAIAPLNFMFLGSDTQLHPRVLRGTSDRSLVSTTDSLERWGSVVTLTTLITAIIAALVVSGLSMAIKNYRAQRLIGRTLALRPVLAEIKKEGTEVSVRYVAHIDGKRMKGTSYLLDGIRPLQMQWNLHLALAVWVAETNQVIVLDEQLGTLDLTDAEKQRLLAFVY